MCVQAVLLTVGRLCCMLTLHTAASDELTRMAVTLLLDTLGSEDDSGLSQVDACAVYTLACLGVTFGMQDCRYLFANSFWLRKLRCPASAIDVLLCMVCVSSTWSHQYECCVAFSSSMLCSAVAPVTCSGSCRS